MTRVFLFVLKCVHSILSNIDFCLLYTSKLPVQFWTENRFSVAILNFFDQTVSRFFNTIFLTNYYHRSWTFAIRILKITQLVLKLLAKNRFSAAILNFYDQTGSRIFEAIFFINFYYRPWKFAIKILKTSQLVLK